MIIPYGRLPPSPVGDRSFSLGSHLKSRDVKAVRKTVSGLVKLIYPNGELSREELAELVELSLEGRRRVKEQLKKWAPSKSNVVFDDRQ